MSTGDPIAVCPICDAVYYVFNGHNCSLHMCRQWQLSLGDQHPLVDTLRDPPAPNTALKELFRNPNKKEKGSTMKNMVIIHQRSPKDRQLTFVGYFDGVAIVCGLSRCAPEGAE
jgi:hypothetical protein